MTQDEALAILKTGCNVFLTGEPGSGKSYVVGRYVSALRKDGVAVSVTASTGIAAAHIGGTTIHAWSGIGTRSQLSRADLDGISKNRRTADRVKKAKVLIIDEISMLSGSILAGVDECVRHLRKSSAPFGGLQLVLVGDFFQLPPIVRRDDRPPIYDDSQDTEDNSLFAYGSKCWRDLDLTVCYLTEQHRQQDAAFTELLGAIRSATIGQSHRELLARRKSSADTGQRSATRLYTHNLDVDRINLAELMKLPGEMRSFAMTTMGDQTLADGLKRGCLSPEKLDLKLHAKVMFTKNDPDGRFVNGTLGVITGFDPEEHYPVVETQNGSRIVVKRAEWKINEDEGVKAGIEQVPLRLAWAITIHKSQGMSLDAALIDLSNAFEYGQGYVALSRVRSLGGLHLLGWNEKALRVHPEALLKDAEFRRASADNRMKAHQVARAAPQKLAQSNEGADRLASRAEGVASARSGQSYKPWTPAEEERLAARYKNGESVADMAKAHDRQPGGIRARLVKLGLILR